MIHSFRERHLLPMVAPAAILRCVGWIDFDGCSSSFFRFGEQLLKKSRPTRIVNALSKTMVMRHPVVLQVFHTDHPETINDLAALLVGEIVTSEGYPFMHTCHYLAMFPAKRRRFLEFSNLEIKRIKKKRIIKKYNLYLINNNFNIIQSITEKYKVLIIK